MKMETRFGDYGGTFVPEILLPALEQLEEAFASAQDDPAFRWAPDRAAMLDHARDADVAVLRTIVAWSDVAPTRPAEPTAARTARVLISK